MNFLSFEKESSLNGVGLRNVLWVAGCSHHCKNCHNPETWDENAGKEFIEEIEIPKILDSIDNEYIKGLTLSGGDPLYPKNIYTVSKIIYNFREKFGNTKDIWLYSGYRIEQLLNKNHKSNEIFYSKLFLTYENYYSSYFESFKKTKDKNEIKLYELLNFETYFVSLKFILNKIDILVDGKFEEDKKIEGLKYKGSFNQRIINMKSPDEVINEEIDNVNLTKKFLEENRKKED